MLPDQQVDDAGFAAFLETFGELVFTTGETPVPGFPDLNIISNVGRTTPPRSTFHVDTSYVRVPPAYTALRAVTIPEVGGETLFSNQYAAYESLPDRAAGAARRSHHRARRDRRRAGAGGGPLGPPPRVPSATRSRAARRST